MIKAAFCFVLLISACKVNEGNIVGSYVLTHFPKTILEINADKTFDFSKNNPNPYLHPFDHPHEYFSFTKGRWVFTDKKDIALTSQSDTVIYPLTEIATLPKRNKDLSHFVFYDSFGDTVKILYVQFTDSSIAARLHRSMDFYTEDLVKRDTLEFHFYGYRPYLFMGGTKVNNDYRITLKAEFQPNFFNETKFKVKRNRLFDVIRHGKFIRQ